jgi:hypothetical protein
MGKLVVLTKTLVAGNAAAIAASQSPGAGAIAINGSSASGGVATLDTQRRVLLSSGGNDSGIQFTVLGTNQAGGAIQETVTGGNATAVQTNQDFLTVGAITHTGSVASTFSAGTTTGTGQTQVAGSTPWQLVDPYVTPTDLAVALLPGAGQTANLEYTYDDFLNLAAGTFPSVWSNAPGQLPAGLKGATGNIDTAMNWPIRGYRLTVVISAGVAATLQAIQAGTKQ